MVWIGCSTPAIPAGREVRADLVFADDNSLRHGLGPSTGLTVWVVWFGSLLSAEPQGQ